MLLALLLVAEAAPKVITEKDWTWSLVLPEGEDAREWRWNTEPGSGSVRMEPADSKTATVTVTMHTGGFQADLGSLDRTWHDGARAAEIDALVGPAGTVERRDHPTLGPVVYLTGQSLAGRAVQRAYVETGDGYLVVAALDDPKAPPPSAMVDEVLGMVRLEHARVPKEQLPYGKFVADGVYSIELPEGWRAATDAEMERMGGERVTKGPLTGKRMHRVFFDPMTPATAHDASAFACTVTVAPKHPLEIVNPEEFPLQGRSFRARTRSLLKFTSYRVGKGDDSAKVEWKRPSNMPVLEVPPEALGDLSVIDLGGRRAYLWKINARWNDRPMEVATLYTSFGDQELDCYAWTPADQTDALNAFLLAAPTLRIVDGDKYPQNVSLQTRYREVWPFRNPWLQAWWLPIPLAAIALWFGWRSTQ